MPASSEIITCIILQIQLMRVSSMLGLHADDCSKLPNIGGNGFIWILLVAAGTFFVTHQAPLEGSRPATTERSISDWFGDQHIDARLWQDPFAAVAEAMEKSSTKSSELKPENCRDPTHVYFNSHYCRSPFHSSAPSESFALVVSTSGAPYSEEHEARRRARYAILAGLDAEGFVPKDPQHIGFYWPRVGVSPTADTSQAAQVIPISAARMVPSGASARPQDVLVPKTVPFEWFKHKNPHDPRKILLLWFDEDVLGPDPLPLNQLASLFCAKRGSSPPPDTFAALGRIRMIGPHSSRILQAMVGEVEGKEESYWSGLCPEWPTSVSRPQFYVSDATASDSTLLPPADAACGAVNCLNLFFDKHGIDLYRLVATDEALARAIREELKLRGVDKQTRSFATRVANWFVGPNPSRSLIKRPERPQGDERARKHSHIVLVSEWDTLYAQALPESMARCFGEERACRQGGDPYGGKDWLHPFKYLRGLDGQMPNDKANSSDASKDTGSKQDKESKDNGKSRLDPRVKDRAEGQSQFDYLRRLGDRIQQLDARLRREGENGIAAVGVLGSDLYDKLLVLQALRPLLPDAWFFTTDLDALFLHPTAQIRTRNLLVASSFGLQLAHEAQGGIPPFRSSYQTAEFLATRAAIQSDGSADGRARRRAWSATPLVFEIGSSRVFQFANRDPTQVRPATTDGMSAAATSANGSPETAVNGNGCKKDLLSCKEIHPAPTEMVPPLSNTLKLGLLTLGLVTGLSLALYILLSFSTVRSGTWHAIDTYMGRAESPAGLIARILVLVLGVAVAIILLGKLLHAGVPTLADWLTQDGQPMIPLEGISVWPTVFLRSATFFLCIWLVARGWQRLDENTEKIIQDLHLRPTWRNVLAGRAAILRLGPPWIKLARRFGYHLPAGGAAQHGNVARFWRKYIYQGHLIARMGRVALGLAAMAVLWFILVLIFGNPHDPTRGQVSLWAYKITTFALIVTTLVLIFCVADATLLCWRVTRAFRAKTAGVWPPRTLQEFSARFDLPQRVLDDWIDLVFVSKRTKCITTLFYYPFLVIALIVVSRSSLFANYGRNIPDLIAMGVGVLIITACAVVLRWTAEESRAKARRRLSQEIIVARNLNDGGHRAGQLEVLLRRVEELREGAFSPFSQQPMVRAMLLPLGSLGGTALLEYLLLPGFI
jgi:hypothetical protein